VGILGYLYFVYLGRLLLNSEIKGYGRHNYLNSTRYSSSKLYCYFYYASVTIFIGGLNYFFYKLQFNDFIYQNIFCKKDDTLCFIGLIFSNKKFFKKRTLIFFVILLVVCFIFKLKYNQWVTAETIKFGMQNKLKVIFYFKSCYIYVYDPELNINKVLEWSKVYLNNQGMSLEQEILLIMDAPNLFPDFSKYWNRYEFFKSNFAENQDLAIARRMLTRHRVGNIKYIIVNLSGNPNLNFDPTGLLNLK